MELESQPYIVPRNLNGITENTSIYLCKHAAIASESLGVKSIITSNNTGVTSRTLCSFRPQVPIYALCNDMHIVRILGLSFGIQPYFVEFSDTSMSGHMFQQLGIRQLVAKNVIEDEELVACLMGATSKGAYSLAINTVNRLK